MGWVFVISVGVIGCAYLGYPLVIGALAALFPQTIRKKTWEPRVSVLVSAHNEADRMEARIRNILEQDYPQDKLELLVGSDGSDDATVSVVERCCDAKRVRCLAVANRRGKPAMINDLVRSAQGEVVVFADARQTFAPDAVSRLVVCLSDEAVGAVSGDLVISDQSSGTGRGMGAYWRYEKWLRQRESACGSMLGVTGAIYGIRRELIDVLPEDMILDDMYIPLKTVLKGKRVVFEPGARAFDRVSGTSRQEFVRKARTLAGNFQIFFRLPQIFNPLVSAVAFQMFFHKFLRLMVPYALLAAFVSNVFLSSRNLFFLVAFLAQCDFYLMALAGYFMERRGVRVQGVARIILVPYEFCIMNLAAVVGLMVYLTRPVNARWER